jgi:glycosyltransferase involved in cell wall biosynthesis
MQQTLKITFIGPFPDPVNGCSLANEVLYRYLTSIDTLSVSKIDTNTPDMSSETVGSYSNKKVLNFLKKYLKTGSIFGSDVIYTTPGQTFFGILKYAPYYLSCIALNKPYIIHVHGNHLGNEYLSLRGWRKGIFRYFISKAAAGIVLSNSLRKNFTGLLPEKKVYSVSNFAEDKIALSHKQVKEKQVLKLLYLSNLMIEKGILDLLDALLILKEKDIHFEASIAGKIEKDIEHVVREKLSQLQPNVKYVGVVHGQKKIDLLSESNIFILPTYYKMEGQPISLIEGMATGNIIITTAFSGIPDIVTTENGFFVEPRNATSIANVLIQVNGQLDYLVTRVSAYNIDYVKSNFTQSIFCENIISIITNVSRPN